MCLERHKIQKETHKTCIQQLIAVVFGYLARLRALFTSIWIYSVLLFFFVFQFCFVAAVIAFICICLLLLYNILSLWHCKPWSRMCAHILQALSRLYSTQRIHVVEWHWFFSNISASNISYHSNHNFSPKCLCVLIYGCFHSPTVQRASFSTPNSLQIFSS